MSKPINGLGAVSTRLDPTRVLPTDVASPGTSPTEQSPLSLVWGKNVIPVYEASDFGTDTGTGYQMTAFKHYVLMDEIALTKSLLPPSDGPVEISSSSWAANSIECTGVFDVFYGTTVFGIYHHNFVVNGDGNQTLYNITSGGSSVAFTITSGVCSFTNMSSLGTISGFNSVDLFSVNFNGFSTGIKVIGNSIMYGTIMVFNSGVTTGIPDVEVSGTSETIVFDKCRHSSSANSIAYKIDNSSVVESGEILNCSWMENGGSFTDPTGKDRTDPNWMMLNNGEAKDSRNTASGYLVPPRTIPVASLGVFYELGGTSVVSKIAERFSISTSGVLTYTGIRPISLMVTVTATVEKSGGGADVIEGRIGVDWTAADTGEVDSSAQTQNSNPTQITMQTQVDIVNSQNIRAIFNNQGSASDIIVTAMNIVIEET